MTFKSKYAEELKAAEALFGADHVKESMELLEQVHNSCEAAFDANLKAFEGREVKYLMICEAAPMPLPGQPISYFYNLKNNKTPILSPVLEAFTGRKPEPKQDYSEILEILREKGFLLVDTLPLAFRYGKARNKTRKGVRLFDELVKLSVFSFLLQRLNDPEINWSPDVKVAFQFTVNARAVMKAMDYKLELPNKTLNLSEELIVTNGSGFGPCNEKLEKVYSL